MQPPIYSVGIDAGQMTGVAVWDRTANKIALLETTDFFGVSDLLRPFGIENIKVFVEIPPAFIYSRNRNLTGAVRDNYAIKSGGTRRESQLLAEQLRRDGFAVAEVPPIGQTKWAAEAFKRHLNYDLKTNQNERDAARIALIYADKSVSSPLFEYTK